MRAITWLAFPILASAILSGQNPTVQSQAPTVRGGTSARAPASDANEPPAVRPEDKCAILGVVLNQATGEAIKRAAISARRIDRPDGNPGSAVSQSDGTFEIRNLDPGRYMLSASKNGFANQAYGARALDGSSGSTITLNAGQTIKDLNFGMTPHGVVAGRVIDDDGEPMAGVSIQVLRSMFRNGKRQTVPINQVTTNDLGEYRMFGLSPGRYYVLARFTMRGMMGEAIDLAYQPAYYPNAADLGAAAPLPVIAGQTTRGVDFTLRRSPSFRITGRVTDSGRTLDRVSVWLATKSPGGMAWDRQGSPVRNGKFEIRGVLPGAYVLGGDSFGTEGARTTARLSITVGNSNLDNLELAFSPGVEITGRVTYEDAPPEDIKNAPPPGRGQTVWLQPKDETMNMMGGAGPIGEGGKFVLKNIGPAAYQVNMQMVSPEAYIKAIRFGDADVTDQGLDLSNGPATGELTIVVSYAGGTIDGTVENGKQEKPAGVQVVAVPELEKRGQPRLFKVAATDQNGHFELKGLAPGEYQLFAFEQIEPGAYQDSEILKPISDKGQRVTVKAKSKETVSLKIVPADLTKVQE